MNARLKIFIAMASLAVLTAFPSSAWAMHITEGILPAPWAALWMAVAAPFVIWGILVIRRRQAADPRYTALVALVGAAIFVISCMPIPVPVVGSCSHPCGTGLGALLIGVGPTVVVATISLVFQAALLAHGGFTTLGANIVSMGVVGALAGLGAYRLLRAFRAPIVVAAFAAGLISDWATYATTSFELASALCRDGSLVAMFVTFAVAFSWTQIPLGILEGMVSALAYRFVLLRRPDLLAGIVCGTGPVPLSVLGAQGEKAAQGLCGIPGENP